MTPRQTVGVVSPNPDGDGGGVERFCNLVASALSADGIPARVIDARSMSSSDYSLLITNGPQAGPKATPRIHVYHGCWPPHVRASKEGSPQWRIHRAITGAIEERRAGRGATKVAVSAQSAREVRRWYGWRSVRVIPNGVDCELFQPRPKELCRERLGIPADEKVALFVGRAESRKRPQWAADTAAELGYTLYWAGTGDLPGAVSLGDLGREALADAYSSVDLVLAPTGYEGCSFAILEALATGAPLVATRVGWVRDLWIGRPSASAFTSPKDDEEAFRRTAERVAAGAADDMLREAALTVRSEHNLARFADDWCRLVRSQVPS